MGLLFCGFILMVLVSNIESERCPGYGCPLAPPINEPFVPALPGHTPRCAKPGQTFCEVLDHYPEHLIKLLVEKCTFDFKAILRDEAPVSFNSYRRDPDYHQGYEYHKPAVPQIYSPTLPFLQSHYNFRQPVYGPPFNGTYQRRFHQPRSKRNPFLPPNPSVLEQQDFRQQSDHYQYLQPFEPLNLDQSLWTNRFARENEVGVASRTRRKNPLLEFTNKKNDRAKRQNQNVISICPTEPNFLTPRAALNNQGNWMFVVNVEEMDKKYSQVIMSEVCQTDTCNALCSLPNGYTSRCEQQYVQKRLLALEGSGNRLYTDVFWFPHGCMCQVTSKPEG
ncbi:protein spaetzle 5 [Belonocnema kinseyi]|uniref:protein spaetzle 5 n=1 Tax=Belonocnema kinseyi TaxID=2817044 RepID=UPI00143DD52A|nr:protein spaetzle 5 [Belonocnema kinseyi]